jgi:hypothetical protein
LLVTAASVQDSVAGAQLLDQVAAGHPGIRKVWVDGGYRQHLVEHAATLGIDMESPPANPGPGDSPRYRSGGRWSGRTAG